MDEDRNSPTRLWRQKRNWRLQLTRLLKAAILESPFTVQAAQTKVGEYNRLRQNSFSKFTKFSFLEERSGTNFVGILNDVFFFLPNCTKSCFSVGIFIGIFIFVFFISYCILF